jgi:hypothetical protein
MRIKKFNDISDFEINEKYHISQDVRHLTNIIYNKIYLLIPNLIIKKEITISNLLQDNYSRIKFKNDIIKIKLGNNHGGIKNIDLKNNIINLELELTINLSSKELSQKKLINNKIKETINHECQHIIEFYHSDGDLSKSWDFHKRLKTHENKFNNRKWLDVCYLFYLAEEHELRSKVSQSLELLKNGEDLYESEIYKNIDLLTRLNTELILDRMNEYDDFGIILFDFVKNVLLKKGDTIKIFKSYIKYINKISLSYKNKILRVLYSYENPNVFLEENIEKDIDYREYIIDDRVEKRDNLISKIIEPKY